MRTTKQEVAAVLRGRSADAVSAAYTVGKAVFRVMRIRVRNWTVSEVLENVTKHFGVRALEGVLSH